MRPAELSDLDTLLTMVRDYHELDHMPFEVQIIRPVLERVISDSTVGRLWMIEGPGDSGVAGYLLLCFGFSIEYQGRDAFVDELYLRPEFRKQGLGGEALQYVSEQARLLGIHALHLECERQNTPAMTLYRKFGFKDPDRVLMTYWV